MLPNIFIAVIKHKNHKKLGEEKVYLAYTLIVGLTLISKSFIKGYQGRNSSQETSNSN